MDRKQIFSQLPGALLPWYDQNRRDLPWRRERNPYHIWVSEIMLQQTRVEAVKGYYSRFIEVLPTVSALAECDDELLHKLWEGLGYYNRARNLKKAARELMEKHNGQMPQEYEAVLNLPGIGEYTAGAICSIAFNLPTPAVDGNVLRVIARITDDHTPVDLSLYKKNVQQALAVIYPDRAGEFTQALMELGATVCGPNRAPDCPNCPCKDFCMGYKSNTAEKLPVRLPKRQRREEKRTVFLLRCGDRYALQKRPEGGLLGGLWEFPNVSGWLDTQDVIAKVEDFGLKTKEIILEVERKHVFTHIQWDMRGIYMETENENDNFSWFTASEIAKQTALPTAFRQFFAKNGPENFWKNP